MKGTVIKNIKLIKVVDGDTIKILLDNEQESIRFVCLDTEESQRAGSKPITNAGILASKWAKEYFGTNEQGIPNQDVWVDLEFDTNDPVEVCLVKHRGNYGRLLCYIYKAGEQENFNVRIVREGWSPYFVKYGSSRLYHREFMEAEAEAQAKGIGIWDPATNAGGKSRDYTTLIPWWYLRNQVVEDYRNAGSQAGVLSVRLNYNEIVEAAKASNQITVLCDLQGGINKWPGNGALIYAGSRFHRFNLWIPDRDSQAAQTILGLIETRYAKSGRGYVYVTGTASLYPPNQDGKPQIVITDAKQLADFPPGQ
ncbi:MULTISPECIES: thermonuclease family protein [unclassified Moorena]|uniref:thermonuclease family protein n=1 Tax=unclassified Moorena TaxID=2683338 RepID=UPI0013B9DBA3|nr:MULTISPECIES: thermonuclease family protein [unclassified Moorena]NEP31919.1 thermonuclease family protein [Moorena sp. SIO3B2]NEQ09277.1 thermonuclease family protein [Moorena sp. SIO4E2]